jgi:hypothetical protein
MSKFMGVELETWFESQVTLYSASNTCGLKDHKKSSRFNCSSAALGSSLHKLSQWGFCRKIPSLRGGVEHVAMAGLGISQFA